jgi:hypothetical protein
VKSALRGGDDLNERITALIETPPTRKWMKKHHLHWSSRELRTESGVERNIP